MTEQEEMARYMYAGKVLGKCVAAAVAMLVAFGSHLGKGSECVAE